MKKIVYLLFLVSALTFAQSKEIIDNPVKKSWFVLDKTVIQIENNFFLENDKNGHDAYSNLLHKEYYFTIYGEKVNLKITNPKDTYNGIIYIDTLKKNSDKYKIENLEFQILKNNKVLKNWTLVTETKNFNERNFHNGKESFENYYLPYTDSLLNGDKLTIIFRKKGEEDILKLHFEKKESARKPFIIASRTGDLTTGKSLENFIQESLLSFDTANYFDKSNLYNSWPEDFSPRNIDNRNRYFKNEKYCLIFRKPNEKQRTFNSFEYRISVNSKVGEWTNSNGIIFLDLNESGTAYKLEVRYKDEPTYIAVYNYSTEPDWYQTLWFKIIIGLLTLLIFLGIYLFWMRKKAKRNQLEQKSKLKMLYAQLNPHFIFNALGSIQGLLNNNEIEKANQYLAGFGSLLRNTLSSSENETVSLETEIKTINNYIELEQLRNPFAYHLTIAETIDVRETQMLPLLAQPLIENAIKHGISNKENGEIKISVIKKEHDLIFKLADNGKGFDFTAEQKGLGLKLVKDRISIFNEASKKMKINMKVESNSSGTEITVFYKNWLNND